MQGGDSIITGAWYNENVITEYPDSPNFFFLFTIGVTANYGFYYSVIDVTQNGGLGSVIQKNVQLQNFANVDCLNAIKHGNGRDWWVIFRKSGTSPGNPNNDFYQYLITPSGIGNVYLQNVGSTITTNAGKITFSPTGNKMVFNSRAGMIEIYDYDRCTGIISNPVTIFPEQLVAPYRFFWGCEFSPNGNVLYVTISDQTSYLFQFDLTSTNIAASIDTLWQTSYPGEAIGGLKRGPDGKIYESGPYTNPTVFIYPYPDSMRNVYNEYLGVINSPDLLGAACNFVPYFFYLGGKRTYWGLPNNPDYDMPRDTNSLCDSLPYVQVQQSTIPKREFNIYYHTIWQTAFINASNLQGKNYTLNIFDITGKQLYSEQGKLSSPYFTKDFHCNFANGIYIISLSTEKENLKGKFIKN